MRKIQKIHCSRATEGTNPGRYFAFGFRQSVVDRPLSCKNATVKQANSAKTVLRKSTQCRYYHNREVPRFQRFSFKRNNSGKKNDWKALTTFISVNCCGFSPAENAANPRGQSFVISIVLTRGKICEPFHSSSSNPNPNLGCWVSFESQIRL